MRGKLLVTNFTPATGGITPADAGKTKRYERSTGESWDHPRGCGENLTVAMTVDSKVGSPPRMRGKRYLSPSSDFGFGITPADAGKTILFTCRSDR